MFANVVVANLLISRRVSTTATKPNIPISTLCEAKMDIVTRFKSPTNTLINEMMSYIDKKYPKNVFKAPSDAVNDALCCHMAVPEVSRVTNSATKTNHPIHESLQGKSIAQAFQVSKQSEDSRHSQRSTFTLEAEKQKVLPLPEMFTLCFS